ncbi:MAG: MoxR family ATPase [Vicinamibacteria bacterium]|nr:MoxR family ATPase [Vicinamibacteria bacterium]
MTARDSGWAKARAREIVNALEQSVVGQHDVCESMVAGFLSGGHILIEGMPGVGKTTLARSLAKLLGMQFSRVQLTPDLMPADLLGANVFDPSTRTFHLVRGPVFTHFLLADEINRTPPKTQSALLEAMQEEQVTIDGVSHVLDPAFFVAATQNPIEHEGTYSLPEAQLDRFALRVIVGLPPDGDEIAMLQAAAEGRALDSRAVPTVVSSLEEARALREASRLVHASAESIAYLQRLAAAVRKAPQVEIGPSPRAALSLLEVGRASALLADRDFLIPDDLKRFAVPVWAHRIRLTAEAEIEGLTPGAAVARVIQTVDVPH